MTEKKENSINETLIKWSIIPKPRYYFRENQRRQLKNFIRCSGREHPLSTIKIEKIKEETISISKTNKMKNKSDEKSNTDNPFDESDSDDDMMDPLSYNNSNKKKKTKNSVIDPLSGVLDPLQHDMGINNNTNTIQDIHTSDNLTQSKAQEYDTHKQFLGWKEKRSNILKKYTTNSKMSVKANFIDVEDDEKQQTSEGDKQQQRIDELEQKRDELQMSQKEYIKRMENNVKRLRNAWKNGKRVLSLKIAIQCSKMLGPQSVSKCAQFYPSMYVLVADVLDSFGDLVFERLKQKAIDGDTKKKNKKTATKTKLRENFTYLDINLTAKETCLNWFYKIACVRELLPRLLIELSLFKCWRFIRPVNDYPKILKRLSGIIRGIGDPLVAGYARAYLVHRGFEVCGDKMRNVLLQTFDDFLFVFNEIDKHSFKNVDVVQKKKISEADYIDLYSPCLDWIIQCIGYKASEEEFFGLLQRYKDGWNNSIILLHVLSQFNDVYISKHSKILSRLIKESFVTTIPRSKLYRELGLSIVAIAPPTKVRLALLNEIWKVVSKIKKASEYCEVASVYIEYILQHFSKKEIDILLNDVIKHLKKDLAFQDLQDDIYSIVSHILKYIKDFKDLFSITNFLPLIDMLTGSNKMNACKSILQSFKRNCKEGISDAVMISSLLDVCRMLHDSVDYLTFEDERRQVTDLISYFVDSIDYGHDLEKQLNEYVECRSLFGNLDGVIYVLITKVGDLAMKAYKFMNGKHNKKTAAFVKACLAYCHITIPSLEDIWPRMYLFAIMGQISLTNQMIVQAEGFLKAAISLIPKLPVTFTTQYSNIVQSTSELLGTYISNLASLLLLIPGHPERGPFYLIDELIESLSQYPPWDNTHFTSNKCIAHISIFKVLCTMSQKEFPYKIVGVASNDQLFGASSKYIKVVKKHLSKLGPKIVYFINGLKNTGKKLDLQSSGTVSLMFINCLVDFVIIEDKTTVKVIKDLYIIAKDAPNINKIYLQNTTNHIKSKYPLLYTQLTT